MKSWIFFKITHSIPQTEIDKTRLLKQSDGYMGVQYTVLRFCFYFIVSIENTLKITTAIWHSMEFVCWLFIHSFNIFHVPVTAGLPVRCCR